MIRLRLILVLVFVCLPLLASFYSRIRAHGEASLDATNVPERLGNHRLRGETPLDEDVVEMLLAESYTMREYGDDSGSRVWLYLAFYSGDGTSGAHDPAVCYPAQGWDPSEPIELELGLPTGEKLTVKVMTAAQAGREEIVLYWFQPADRWPVRATAEHLSRVVDRLRGHPQYGFVRLSTQLLRSDVASRENAGARLAAIAVELAPWVRQAVSRPQS